ncbi:unnamed protein product [Phyllotreta striolata]|uniref:Cytochrome P450 n=1 Tax=Phyllotreta striolata TaxID=444603 RepID=A0A9N9TS19_PHYSR|nr:unnamed protein product [Phyllotreta striolata]
MWELLAVLLVAFHWFCIRPHKYWRNKGVHQGKSLWLLGDAWGFVFRLHSFAELLQYLYKKFPQRRYYGAYLFNYPILVVKDPDLIKEITIRDFEHFEDHSAWLPEQSDPLWNQNLFSLKGQKWKDLRNFFRPTFTSSRIKTMYKLMNRCAESFVEYFAEKEEDLIEVDLKYTFKRFTCNVIATTVFGVRVDTLRKPDSRFYQMGLEATNTSGFRSFIYLLHYLFPESVLKFLRIKVYSENVRTFFSNLVEDTMRTREEQNIYRPDLIQLILDAKKGKLIKEDNVIDRGFAVARQEENYGTSDTHARDITNTEITAQALIFFFGGFDTVSALMKFTAYELVVNQEIQRKLRAEINEKYAKCNGAISYEEILDMNYLDMVISECLRKWPSGLAVERVCTKSYVIQPKLPDEREVTLDVGTLITIPTFGIHRDPEYYPDPEVFDPERFNEENKRLIKPYTFFPFGLGPRNCIGSRFAILEAKVLLVHLLRRFEIVPTEKSTIPIGINRSDFHLDGNGFWFGLKKITKID